MSTANGDTSDLRERPIGEIAGELTRDLSLLVRQELELAKAEMAEKAKVAAPGLGMLGGASVVGLMAAGALTACLVLVLSTFLPDWLSALLVGVGVGGRRLPARHAWQGNRSRRPALQSLNKPSKQ